jgi:hypothetical protein
MNPRFRRSPRAFILVLSCTLPPALATPPLRGQGPGDYDLLLRTDKEAYAPGDVVRLEAGVEARAAGIEGWTFGVLHDAGVLALESATSDGTDVPGARREPSFELTTVVVEEGVPVGFVQAVVLSLVLPAQVPVSDFFSMATAVYRVGGACVAGNEDVSPEIRFVDDLRRAGDPAGAFESQVVVGGRSVVPAVKRSATVRVRCAGLPDGLLSLRFGKDQPLELVADRSSRLDVGVHLVNEESAQPFDVQAWSYGIQVDTALMRPVAAAFGVDSRALRGGAGPEFFSYNLDDESADGNIRGVSVGMLIDLGAPGNNVLPVAFEQSVHLDTITFESVIRLQEGDPERTAVLRFVDEVLGRDRPIDVEISVGGFALEPDFSDAAGITLKAPAAPAGARFIRGDANNDGRVDIGDGIWIISMLFYGRTRTACLAAANANGDRNPKTGREQVDIADAMYLFNWQLQPGATPGNLFPPPPPPTPTGRRLADCGSVPEVLEEDCPAGSTLCSA